MEDEADVVGKAAGPLRHHLGVAGPMPRWNLRPGTQVCQLSHATFKLNEALMRMMLQWTVPVEKGNAMIEDGSMGTTIETLMDQLKPEAAYFLAHNGKRSGMLFFDMKEPADIPRIAEVLFLQANADVEFVPVMNGDDLKKALGSLPG